MIYNNDIDPNVKMWEEQNKVDAPVTMSRIEQHKDLITKVVKLNNEIMDIQEEKFKILTDFLEYEEALTTDKETAARITKLLKSIEVWK